MNLLLFICAIVLVACWVAFGVMEIFYLVRNNKSPDFANEIEVIKQIVESLVIEQNQLTVDKLKLFSKSGMLTEEQAKEVFDYVYNEAMEILGESKSFKKLQEIYGDRDVLKVLIEDAVYKNKRTYSHLEALEIVTEADGTDDKHDPKIVEL